MSTINYPPAFGHSGNVMLMKCLESTMDPNQPIFSPEFIKRYGKPVYDYCIWEHMWSGDLTFEPPTYNHNYLPFLQFVRQHGYKAFVNDCFTKTCRPGNPVGLTRLKVDKAYTRCLVDLFDNTEEKEIQRPSKSNKNKNEEEIHQLRRKQLKKAMEQRFGSDAEICWTKVQIKYHLPDDAVKAIPDSVFSFEDQDFDDMDDDNDEDDPEAWMKIVREANGDPEDDEDEDSHIAAEDEGMEMVEDENLEDEDTEMADDGYDTFFSGLTNRTRPE